MPEGGITDIFVNPTEESASEVDTCFEEEMDAMEDHSGSEEGVQPSKSNRSTKLKSLSSTITTTVVEGTSRRTSRKSVVSGFRDSTAGGGVGLKRRRETMSVAVSNGKSEVMNLKLH